MAPKTPTVPGPSYRLDPVDAEDVRLVALLEGLTESALVKRIVRSAIRRRLARRLPRDTVAPSTNGETP